MTSPWFVDHSDHFVPLKSYLAGPVDQRDLLKLCMDISKIAQALTETEKRPREINLDSVGVRGGSLVIISARGKVSLEKSLGSLAKVANQISSLLDSPYKPEATGTLSNFEAFSQRAVSLFRTY